ncbi:MAG: hypothetical protein ACE5FA_02575 [Dehalococcoidia bacterium]
MATFKNRDNRSSFGLSPVPTNSLAIKKLMSASTAITPRPAAIPAVDVMVEIVDVVVVEII